MLVHLQLNNKNMKKVYIKRLDLFKNIPMILFNNILKADEDFMDNNSELFSNECENCEGEGEKDNETCDECFGNGYQSYEVYQYYAIGVNDYIIDDLKEYGVEVGYSEKLDLYILPIYDYGTGWDMFSYSKEVEDDYTLGYNETTELLTPYCS